MTPDSAFLTKSIKGHVDLHLIFSPFPLFLEFHFSCFLKPVTAELISPSMLKSLSHFCGDFFFLCQFSCTHFKLSWLGPLLIQHQIFFPMFLQLAYHVQAKLHSFASYFNLDIVPPYLTRVCFIDPSPEYTLDINFSVYTALLKTFRHAIRHILFQSWLFQFPI